ncbi:MAG: hypothetical protein ABR511_13680 [Acidimicrobiales bacterium]
MRRSSRPAAPTRLRWLAAPLAGVAMLGAYAMVPTLAGADAPPNLPPVSAADLVAKVEQASVPGLAGTITSSPHLGLPDLGSVMGDQGSFATDLLTGAHSMDVWQAGSDIRLRLPSTLAESDLVKHGTDVWDWQSSGQQVSHLALQGDAGGSDTNQHPGTDPTEVAPTPQALAQHFLDSVDATTRVFVRDTVTVAGRPAYELVLAPRSATTLVADVVVAVDSATGLPLRVQVLAKDSGTPAVDVGFSSLDMSVPAASNFSFTPPPGATVTEAHSAADLLLPAHSENGPSGPQVKGGPSGSLAEPTTPPTGSQTGADRSTQVVGTGWDSVAVIDLGSDGTNPTVANLSKLGSAVSGSWGSGHLVHTSLFNVLLTDKGTLLVGAVPEAALEAAAAGH